MAKGATIGVSTSEVASAIRAFPWPVLETGNGAFSDGEYAVSVEHREYGRSFLLTHQLSGAPLLERWGDEGKVAYTCAAAAPVSAYRQLHRSSDRSQLIQWDPDDLGCPPMFTPAVVAVGTMHYTIDALRDGLNALWDGRTIHLSEGARLAVGPTFALQSGLLGLLQFLEDQSASAGRFRVEPSHEGGFRFNVHLATDLFRFLRSRRREPGRWNVMTHVVSAALARLQRDFPDDDGDEGWKSYANLVALSEELERRGLPDWSEDTFQPEVAATALYPHRMDVTDDDD